MKTKNYYDLLEVSSQASAEVIRAAYRTLMKRFHPDHNDGKDDVAKLLSEAYEVLSDSKARAKYDRERNDLKGKCIGNFRILEKIAEGGFGKTYKGEHVVTGGLVCIKHCSQISSQDNLILIEEAQAMWSLHHYEIPSVHDLVELEDGSYALIMSYIPGPTIAQIVEKRGPIDPEHVAWIAQRILNALSFIHHHGVVHGDVKPQNVIVQPEIHTVALVDFGLAMIKPNKDSAAKGYTDFFAPPEQMAAGPLLPQTDFYSLGMTMIYALTGKVECLARKQVPDSVPEPLCAFIRRLIVRDPLSRPDWKTEKLTDSIEKVRMKAFGRATSELKELIV